MNQPIPSADTLYSVAIPTVQYSVIEGKTDDEIRNIVEEHDDGYRDQIKSLIGDMGEVLNIEHGVVVIKIATGTRDSINTILADADIGELKPYEKIDMQALEDMTASSEYDDEYADYLDEPIGNHSCSDKDD